MSAVNELLPMRERLRDGFFMVRGRREGYISRGDGKLILRPSADKLNDAEGIPSFIALRQPDFECIFETELDFAPKETGDEAGMAAYLTPLNNYRLCKRRENGRNYIIVKRRIDDIMQEDYRTEIPDGRLIFRIVSSEGKYGFLYSINGSEYIKAAAVTAKYLTTDVADRCFTGTVIGVYAESDSEAAAETDVYSFKSRIIQIHME